MTVPGMTRVPTVIEAVANVGRVSVDKASAHIQANGTIGDRCTLSPHSVNPSRDDIAVVFNVVVYNSLGPWEAEV